MTRVTPRLIALDVEGTDRSDEISKAVISSAASSADFMSLAEARSGGKRDYVRAMTIAQDHASGTLWDLVWTGAGTEVTGTYAPHGNAEASVEEPHFDFTASVREPDGDFLGAEANPSLTEVATIEVAWPLVGKPAKRTAPVIP